MQEPTKRSPAGRAAATLAGLLCWAAVSDGAWERVESAPQLSSGALVVRSADGGIAVDRAPVAGGRLLQLARIGPESALLTQGGCL